MIAGPSPIVRPRTVPPRRARRLATPLHDSHHGRTGAHAAHRREGMVKSAGRGVSEARPPEVCFVALLAGTQVGSMTRAEA
jgi:hypothetical protein